MEASVPGESAAGAAAQSDASAPVTPTGDSEAGAEAGPEDAPAPRPILRLRNRRRRRRRPHVGAPSPDAGGGPDSAAEPVAGDGMASSAARSDMPATENVPTVAPGTRPARPRRRRRPAQIPGDAAASPGKETPDAEPGTRPVRSRSRRRRAAPPGSTVGDAGERGPREAGAPDRTGSPRGPRTRHGEGPRTAGERQDTPREGRPRGDQRDGRRGDQRDGRPAGRGRAAPPRRLERTLYSFDSVVDRGFDDVEEETGIRRVHWTIVKRTTADQISRKPVSAIYVLQRDGTDREFPNLGAARNEVNKTIVHPEKLTRSKAEYAAEKTGKK